MRSRHSEITPGLVILEISGLAVKAVRGGISGWRYFTKYKNMTWFAKLILTTVVLSFLVVQSRGISCLTKSLVFALNGTSNQLLKRKKCGSNVASFDAVVFSRI